MPSILTIQSHVVHGYVGNRAATFPLQLRGWDADALNTVSLSNHTGYGKFKGYKVTPEDLWLQYEGLRDVNFEYDAMLTGYTPSAKGVKVVGQIGEDLKKRFPNLIWVLDPVIGDEGTLYVAPEVVPAYKTIMKSGFVSLITPNGFEAETLVGFSLDGIESIKKCLHILHKELNVPNVAITSIKLHGDEANLISVGSTCDATTGIIQSFYFSFPNLHSYFTGTGDLFAALLADRFYHEKTDKKSSKPLENAMQKVLAVMHTVLTSTMKNSQDHGPGKRGDAEAMKHMELQVIASRNYLLGEPSRESLYPSMPLP